MKKLLLLLSIILLASCAKDDTNFTLKGTIKGLKKGTVYLQKMKDSNVVTLDFKKIDGNAEFELSTNLESPQMLFLKLERNDGASGELPFFASEGEMQLNTSLKNFYVDAKVKGSKQQTVLEEYKAMMTKFNDKNLDYIKENLEAEMKNDTAKLSSSYDSYEKLLRRKYLYTINFAVNNKDSEVAPYVAVTEIRDANVKFLDTIYNALTKDVQGSKYGKELKFLIDKRKKEK